jgi:hypothetical protein
MKATLGPVNYKKLKGLTKDFAMDELAADAYVDHAAALFDQGYSDPDFWNFLPCLLESCPNEFTANQALQYMDNKKRMGNGAVNVNANAEPAMASNANRQYSANNFASPSLPTASIANRQYPANNYAAPSPQQAVDTGGAGWGSLPSRVTAAAPLPARSISSAPGTRYVPPPRKVPGTRTVPGKAKTAWGGAGGASTVVQAKAPAGSVIAAAAKVAAKGETGTATKFMAKHNKQQKHDAMTAVETKKGKNKKKQKDELRSLAFGK